MILKKILPALLILFLASEVSAQMFSVGSAPERTVISTVSVTLGYIPTTMSFQGTEPDRSNFRRFDFSSPVYGIRLETPSFNIWYGFNSDIPGDEVEDERISYNNVGIELRNIIPVTRDPSILVLVPITLHTEFSRVSTGLTRNSSNDFSVNSFYIGSGLDTHFRLARQVRLQISGLGRFGYSINNGVEGGLAYGADQVNRLHFDGLFGDIGITLGTNIGYYFHSINDDAFKYDFFSTGAFLGINF